MNGSSMLVDPINAEILWEIKNFHPDGNIWPKSKNSWHRMKLTAESSTISLSSPTVTIPQSTPKPMLEISFYPGMEQTEIGARKFQLYYSDGRGPTLPIDVSISDSSDDFFFERKINRLCVFISHIKTTDYHNNSQL